MFYSHHKVSVFVPVYIYIYIYKQCTQEKEEEEKFTEKLINTMLVIITPYEESNALILIFM